MHCGPLYLINNSLNSSLNAHYTLQFWYAELKAFFLCYLCINILTLFLRRLRNPLHQVGFIEIEGIHKIPLKVQWHLNLEIRACQDLIIACHRLLWFCQGVLSSRQSGRHIHFLHQAPATHTKIMLHYYQRWRTQCVHM